MKRFLLPIVLMISGCAVKPQIYDLSTSSILPPIVTKQNIPNIVVSDFKYEPNIRISQNTISFLGCLACQSDGGTPGFLFEEPVGKIVQTEVKAALKEVMLPTSKSSCVLNATIHLAAWNLMDGDSTVDLTYILLSSNQVKFIKRVRGYHDASLFELNKIDRILAKASRSSVEKLITDDEFLKTVGINCPKIQ
jgi:hypothetical protein